MPQKGLPGQDPQNRVASSAHPGFQALAGYRGEFGLVLSHTTPPVEPGSQTLAPNLEVLGII